jgi:hypothetical protein
MGLLWSWVLAPVEYVDMAPGTLREDFKDQYRLTIALAYMANPDLARAQARLQLLQDPDPAAALSALAQRALADGQPDQSVRALADLASVANNPPASLPSAVPLTQFPTPTPSPTLFVTSVPTATLTTTPTLTPTLTATPILSITAGANLSVTATARPSRTPTPTSTPFPTATATPTPGNPYVLDRRSLICDAAISGPLLIVRTADDQGRGVPGVEVVVTWSDGEDHFFTGLKPEFGLGYADFRMTLDVLYSLRLVGGSQVITDLLAAECETEEGQRIMGSWELIFVQP